MNPQFGKRSHWIIAVVMMAMLMLPWAVFADNTVADGDGVTPVTDQNLDFGTVCAGTTTTKTALIVIKRNGAAGSPNVFNDGSTVTVSINSISGNGLSAIMMPSPATITLPGNWSSLSNNTNSNSVSSEVTLVAGAPGAFSGSVVYRGTGKNSSNSDINRDDTMTVNATIVSCYTFLGLYDPYAGPDARAFKINSTIPLKWQYALGDKVVDSSGANPTVNIVGPYVCNGDTSGAETVAVTDAGASGYQYDDTTHTWQFNWQTKGRKEGCYNISVTSSLGGSPTFPIWLRK
ncbi:MAG: PxKF domain-containing protein [Ardenticatenaceae bacterium]|nr:PxKF domain-containing protein [Ardenticatenaceae bacterium]